MDLIFNEINGRWESEMMVTADFNLHIEGLPEGNISVYQRGTESGEYAYVRGATPYPSVGTVYEYDFSAVIFPKYIKVSCASAPSLAVVTSEGEVVPIEKPVEPDTPSEPEALTYEFDIPMTKQEEMGITFYDGQITNQDYSEIFDKILEVARAYGDSGDGWCSLYDEETVKEYTNITVNGFRATSIAWYESSNNIDIGTDGPENDFAMSVLNLYKTYVYFSSPVPKKEEPSDVIEYHFEFNNLEENRMMALGEVALEETQEGDFSELFNKLRELIMNNPNEGTSSFYDETLTFTNITMNGYRADTFTDYGDYIGILATDGPTGMQLVTSADISPTSVYFCMPQL